MDDNHNYIPGALSQFLENSDNLLINKESLKKKTRRDNSTVTKLFGKHSENIQEVELPSFQKSIPIEKKIVESAPENPNGSSRLTQRLNRQKKVNALRDEANRTVFVGNAPLESTRKEVRKIFSKYGKIESVHLRSVIPSKETLSKKVAVLKNSISNSMTSKNFYVKFIDAASAEAALASNGEKFNGHSLRVNRSTTKYYDSKTTLFIGNVAYNVKEEELVEHFTQAGEVLFVRIVRDAQTGRGKGFAFVSFKDASSLPSALRMDETFFHERALRVKRILKKSKRQVNRNTLNSSSRARPKNKLGQKEKQGHHSITRESAQEVANYASSSKRKLSKKVVKMIRKRKRPKVKSAMS